MQLRLREIYSNGRMPHRSGSIDISEIVSNDPSLEGGGPMQVEIDAEAVERNIVVTGKADGELDFICSRCLTVFRNRVTVRFEEIFSNKPLAEESETPAADEPVIHYVTEDKVDLVPYIEEHILLELPRFPLCDQHCQGLCPECGTNHNTNVCQCNDKKTDPRWSGLQDLFQS